MERERNANNQSVKSGAQTGLAWKQKGWQKGWWWPVCLCKGWLLFHYFYGDGNDSRKFSKAPPILLPSYVTFALCLLLFSLPWDWWTLSRAGQVGLEMSSHQVQSMYTSLTSSQYILTATFYNCRWGTLHVTSKELLLSEFKFMPVSRAQVYNYHNKESSLLFSFFSC